MKVLEKSTNNCPKTFVLTLSIIKLYTLKIKKKGPENKWTKERAIKIAKGLDKRKCCLCGGKLKGEPRQGEEKMQESKVREEAEGGDGG